MKYTIIERTEEYVYLDPLGICYWSGFILIYLNDIRCTLYALCHSHS